MIYHCRYVAVIERDDGTTYEQPYVGPDDLKEILYSCGHDYKVVDIYSIVED